MKGPCLFAGHGWYMAPFCVLAGLGADFAAQHDVYVDSNSGIVHVCRYCCCCYWLVGGASGTLGNGGLCNDELSGKALSGKALMVVAQVLAALIHPASFKTENSSIRGLWELNFTISKRYGWLQWAVAGAVQCRWCSDNVGLALQELVAFVEHLLSGSYICPLDGGAG